MAKKTTKKVTSLKKEIKARKAKIAKQEGKFKDEPDDPDMEEEKPQAVTVRFSRVSCSSFL